jgi:hypothetical protein
LYGARSGLGQFNPKAASFAGLGLHAHGAPHAFSAFTDDGQADAGSGKILLVDQPGKRMKKFAEILAVDSNSVVSDAEPDHTDVMLGPNFDSRWRIAGSELERIGKQIGKDLFQNERAGLNGKERLAELYPGSFLLDLILEKKQHFMNELFEINSLEHQIRRVESPILQQIKDELVHPSSGVLDP